MANKIKYWWVSWYQPTEDYRPLTFPPVPELLGYWCSGSTYEDPPRHTLCAAVLGDSEAEAKANINKYWPEATDWRFCEKCEYEIDGWWSDRFPLPDWSPLIDLLDN